MNSKYTVATPYMTESDFSVSARPVCLLHPVYELM